MDELKNEDLQDDELERYGVWVKAGPEEVVEAEEDFAFTDLPGGDASGEAPPLDAGPAAHDTDTDTDTDEFSLDDLDFPEDIDDLDVDDHGPLSDAGSATDEESVSLDLVSDDDELAIAPVEEAAGGDDDLVSLDDLDIDVPETEPDPFASLEEEGLEAPGTADSDSDADGFALDEITEDLPDDYEEMDLDAADPLSGEDEEDFDASMPGADDELGDLNEEDIAESASTEDLPELEVDDEAASDEHDFTPEAVGIDIADEKPANRLTPDEEEFLEDDSDLQNDPESAIPPEMDLQEREAFQRIQTELTDIRRELSELKEALRAGVNPLAGRDTPADEEDSGLEDEAGTGPGFFDEEEDETIALTGDELDNILNTAEFTEEVGEEAELEDEYLVDPPAESGEEDELPVQSIELEPVSDSTSVFEGDESAVDELAEMDIDRELADIDQLTDETSSDQEDTPEIEDLELDVDALDEVEDIDTDGDEDILGSQLEEAGQEAAAAADQQALEAEPELEEDDFDDFAAAVEDDIASGGVEADDSFDAPEETAEVAPSPSSEDAEDFGEEIEIDLDDFDSDDASGGEDLEDTALTADDFTDDTDASDEPEDLDVGDLDGGDFDLEEPEVEPGEPEEPAEAEQTPEPDEAPEPEEPTEAEDATEPVQAPAAAASEDSTISDLPEGLKQEIRSVLSYMDQLLEALPDDKIEEFAHSEHFEVYKRLFEELGLETEG